jgi:photosystem II stability/assembly factor-like uncharacterized protein
MKTRVSTSWACLAAAGILLFGLSATAPALVQALPQAGSPAQHATAQPGAQTKPKLKAIWEPVNYTEDVNLSDVFFVNATVGWVSGGVEGKGAGVILNTQDGGDHWTVQWGDPNGADNAPSDFFFLDSTHGWVRQGYGKLLHTTDGQLWAPGGTIDAHSTNYTFVSETTGFALKDHEIQRTVDGGHTWKIVNECAVKVEVDGLTRNVDCLWSKVQFPTATDGYAVGYIASMNAPHAALGKTVDGGATWTVSVVEGLSGGGGDVFFFDPNTGFMRAGGFVDGQLYKTTDAGATWKPMATVPGKRFGFADREVGWSFLGRDLHYTTDGGLHWNSRAIPFPVEVNAWSLPQRARGYAVGDHGMIYRYRVVPADYSAKGMLAAPMVSAAP